MPRNTRTGSKQSVPASFTQKDLAKRALWFKGDLDWKLRPVQQRMYEIARATKGLKTVINSSRRIGKSFTLGVMAIEHSLQKPGRMVRFACPTQKALKKIVLPIFRELLRDCPPELRPQFKVTDAVFIFPNGSEIHLAGCTNGHEENLRGQTATLCLVDEAGFIKNLEYVLDDILMPQLLTTDGKLVMASTPPRTPAHSFAEYCHQAEIDGAYAKFTIYDSGYAPELIEKFKKEAGGENSTTWKREYLAEFVVDSDFAITPEWNDLYCVDAVQDTLYPYWHRYDAMDTGFRDFTAILYGHYNFREARLYVEDESTIHGPSMTTKLIADTVRPKELELWGHNKTYRRVADNNDPIVLQDLSLTHDLNFVPTDKESLQAMVNKVREWVAAGRIRVSPKCKYLIGCLKYGVWDDNRKMFERSKVYKHFDHLAALVYLVRNIDEATNPAPLYLGVDLANTLVRRTQKLSNVGKALKNAYGSKFSK